MPPPCRAVAVALLLAQTAWCSWAVPACVVNVGSDALPDGPITVVTYNVLHGFADRVNGGTLEARLVQLIAVLAAIAPDIVLLQEVSVTRRHGNVLDRLREGLNRALADQGVRYGSALALNHGSFLIGFHEGSAILSRGEILSAEARVYRSQAVIPPERRIALHASVRTTAGVLAVVGTHLTHREGRRAGLLKRELQARELAAWAEVWAAGGPVILGGDFNADPDTGVLHALLGAGFLDTWAAARPDDPGFTSLAGGVTDVEDLPDQRIDYLLASGLRVLDAWRFLDRPVRLPDGSEVWVSDHAGVAARLGRP